MTCNLYSAHTNSRAIDTATNYPHESLKVSSKRIPGGTTREPRFSVAVDGAEDLKGCQRALVNPQPRYRGSPKDLPRSVPFLQQNHHRRTPEDLVTESWPAFSAEQVLTYAKFRDTFIRSGMMVRGSDWWLKSSNLWTTEEPSFWTTATYNVFSIDVINSLFRGLSTVAGSGWPSFSDLSNLSRGNYIYSFRGVSPIIEVLWVSSSTLTDTVTMRPLGTCDSLCHGISGQKPSYLFLSDRTHHIFNGTWHTWLKNLPWPPRLPWLLWWLQEKGRGRYSFGLLCDWWCTRHMAGGAPYPVMALVWGHKGFLAGKCKFMC